VHQVGLFTKIILRCTVSSTYSYSLCLSIYYPQMHKITILPVVLYRCENSSHIKGWSSSSIHIL